MIRAVRARTAKNGHLLDPCDDSDLSVRPPVKKALFVRVFPDSCGSVTDQKLQPILSRKTIKGLERTVTIKIPDLDTQSQQTSLEHQSGAVSRRNLLLAGSSLAALSAFGTVAPVKKTHAQRQPPASAGRKPNILVIFGDDIGQTNISAYSHGVMGYRTPNIDRLAKEGMIFTDYYAEQSCTAGRSSLITGQATLRTGLSKVGIPGATVGLQARDV
jgi:Sulfatase